LYEQSQNFNKMQNEFIDIAAHELRSPIQPNPQVLQSKIKIVITYKSSTCLTCTNRTDWCSSYVPLITPSIDK
jgi:hypothetical protein